jgi:hypothetical protein
MENLQKAIGYTSEKDAIGFKETIANELAGRLHSAILARKTSIAGTLNAEETKTEQETSSENIELPETQEEVSEANIIAPSAPTIGGKVGTPGTERGNAGVGEVPDPLAEIRAEIENAFAGNNSASALKTKIPTAGSAASQDGQTDLDPNFEKEFYIKEMDYKGHKVVLKQVGLGLSKPIRVYVDDKKWEFFPGPESAIKSARSYIDEMIEKESEMQSQTESLVNEKVEIDARTRAFKGTLSRLENARKIRETKQPPTAVENKPLTNKEILDSVNMKNGKFIMREEEMSDKQKEYRKFFTSALKKHGASSPSEMDDAKKKKFFDYVKANWKG